MRTFVVSALCLAFPLALMAGDAGKAREIDVKGMKITAKKGPIKSPTIITNAEELDKAIPGSEGVKKQVDFAKEKLVLFSWSGSGGDKLAGQLSGDGKTATFLYSPGLTRDLRPHVHLYAIPKGAEVKVEGGR